MGTIKRITLLSFVLAAIAGVLGKVMPKKKFMGFVVKRGFWGFTKYKTFKVLKNAVIGLHKASGQSYKGLKWPAFFGRKLAKT